MYAKYVTDAIVIGNTPQGEADARVTLFTREFGLVRARASAARREQSRMRCAVQSFTIVRASLIRGKDWRLAGAVACVSLCSGPRESLASFARISRLVTRLIGGEEQNEKLYNLLESAHAALRVADARMCPTIELLCVARMLHTLGYLSSDALGTALATETLFAPEMLVSAESERMAILTSVNRALSETQL